MATKTITPLVTEIEVRRIQSTRHRLTGLKDSLSRAQRGARYCGGLGVAMQSPKRLPVLLFFLLILATTSAHSQSYLFNKMDLPTGKSPQALAVGDFNKDGMPDFAVANNSDGTVSVFLGRANGTFKALTPISTGASTAPSALVVADFNGDGKLDLAVALNGANSVAVFTGKGDGTFNAAQSFAVGTGPVALVAADFNGDKKQDLAIANYTASSITVLLNTSSGGSLSFKEASGSPFATSSNPTSVTAADFNGDNKLDLAVGTWTGRNVNIFLGSGTGSFTAGTTVNFGQPTWAVAAADFDGDGKIDLAAGGVYWAQVYPGNGDGTFSTSAASVSNNDGVYAFLVADVNGDKKPDLLTVDANGYPNQSVHFSVNLNNSTVGHVSFVYPGVPHACEYQPAALALGDFNHDGKLDALVANQGANSVSILLGDGKGNFESQSPTLTGGSGYSQITAADFNGDKNLDLAISSMYGGSASNGVVVVWPGKGNGTFGPSTVYQLGNQSYGLVAADLNGDGATDLAVVNESDNDVSILLNNGKGAFPARSPTYPTGHKPVAVAAGNFRLTGHIDLAVANSADDTISILPNDGTGKFGSPTILSLGAGNSPAQLVTGDFNGDGHPDLAVVDGNFVSVFLNHNGSFGSPATINISQQATWISTASLRNNGILDLVAAYGEGVVVLLGNGKGTFAAPVDYKIPSGPISLRIADINGDGIPDLVLANSSENTVGILLGKGDGTFLAEIRYQVWNPDSGHCNVVPWDVVAGDFNNDGFNDFIAFDYCGDYYSVFLNTPAAAIWPTSLNFGTLELGRTSSAEAGNLYNSGVASLKPTVKISPSDYAATGDTCPKSLTNGSSCTVSVTFSPKDINSRNGSISFSDNATVTAQVITLAGVGTEVNISPDPVAFGSVAHGTSKTLTATIQNLSGGSFPAHAMTFNSIAVSGTDFSLTKNACPVNPKTLAAGASCTVTVQFAPGGTGNFTGTLTLTDNGGGSPQKIALSGSGT